MGTEAAEVVEALPYSCTAKVHHSMCTKLMKLVDKISDIFPEIKAAQPPSGIQALCFLDRTLESAKSFLQYCSESSKLYLAFRGNAVVSNCERLRDSLQQSLSQIQNMVRGTLAVEISRIIEDLRDAKFVLDSSEEEAGKALCALLQQDTSGSDSIDSCVFEALKLAASRLHIKSPKALLIEKRSVKKLLLNQVGDGVLTKKKTLTHLLSLLEEYGKLLTIDQTENEFPSHDESFSVANSCNTSLYGQSLEEEYGKNEAQTDMLSKSVPTEETSSIASFGSPVNDPCFQLDLSDISLGSLEMPTCNNSQKFQPYENTLGAKHLSELAALSWECQCKAVEDVSNYLISNDQACYSLSSGNLFVPLTRFLEEARDQHDVNALRSGSQLLAFVSKRRNEKQYLGEDVFALLASLLDSEVSEAVLAIIEVLSEHPYYGSEIAASGALASILMNLETRTREFREPAIKILYNLSSDSENHSILVSLECILKLVPLMADSSLAKYCIVIFQNLCEAEEARVCVAKAKGCIAAISELLENGSHEDQKHAIDVLVSLCSHHVRYCQLVMEADVVSSLFDISVNGNDGGKASASALLQILRDIDRADVQECSGPNPDNSRDSGDKLEENKRLSTKKSRFFERLPMFLKKKK